MGCNLTTGNWFSTPSWCRFTVFPITRCDCTMWIWFLAPYPCHRLLLCYAIPHVGFDSSIAFVGIGRMAMTVVLDWWRTVLSTNDLNAVDVTESVQLRRRTWLRFLIPACACNQGNRCHKNLTSDRAWGVQILRQDSWRWRLIEQRW